MRETIIVPDKVLGYKMGYPVILREISPGKMKEHRFHEEIFYMRTVSPRLFVVIWGGKRIDGFLSKKRASVR